MKMKYSVWNFIYGTLFDKNIQIHFIHYIESALPPPSNNQTVCGREGSYHTELIIQYHLQGNTKR